MNLRYLLITAVIAASLSPVASRAQDSTPASVLTTAPVPHYVRYSSSITDAEAGKSIQLRFALYENQTGGRPVWSEVQTVTPAEAGKYSVLLGAATENGLPQSVFSSAQARWLGISVGEAQEQARTILLATPYSLKASDAETLAGHPVTDFVLAGSMGNTGSAGINSTAGSSTAAATTASPSAASGKAKPNSSTEISQINLNPGLTITNAGTGPTVIMGVDTTKVPMLSSPNTFTHTITISNGNLALPPSSSVNSGALTIGGSTIINTFSTYGGLNNLFFGSGSGNYTNWAKYDVGLGNGTLHALTSGVSNAVVGNQSLSLNTIGSYNTALGGYAGYYNVTGNNNTFLGNTAGPPVGFPGLVNATAIGANAIIEQSNSLVLGGTGNYAVNVGIGTTAPGYTLDVHGTENLTSNLGVGGDTTLVNLATSGTNVFGGASTFNGNTTFNGSDIYNGMQLIQDDYSGEGGLLSLFNISGTSPSIYAISENGDGIDVSGDAYGISVYGTIGLGAQGVTYGVFAEGSSYGGYFGGTGEGATAVFAEGNGTGVYALGGGIGLFGVTSSSGGSAVFAGQVGPSNTYEDDPLAGALNADTDVAWTGSTSWGAIVATADDNSAAFLSNNSDETNSFRATLSVANNTSSTDAIIATFIDGSDNDCTVWAGGYIDCSSDDVTHVRRADGHTIQVFSGGSTEHWIEDYGSGQLSGGVATIQLDPGFLGVSNTAVEYHVFLTPKGDSKGLYITNEGPNGFEVHESSGGASSIAFDYRIVAKRKGFESARLTDITARIAKQHEKAQQKAATMAAYGKHPVKMLAPRPTPAHFPTKLAPPAVKPSTHNKSASLHAVR
jgi:hypothetical protein